MARRGIVARCTRLSTDEETVVVARYIHEATGDQIVRKPGMDNDDWLEAAIMFGNKHGRSKFRSSTGFSDDMQLDTARELLIEQVIEDDSNTRCPLCDKRARNDSKGMTCWQAKAMFRIAGKVSRSGNVHSPKDGVFGHVFHLATLTGATTGDTDASRDHGASGLRHWGFIIEEKNRPISAPDEQVGSRGLSGFYRMSKSGWDAIDGAAFHKNIFKKFRSNEWVLYGPLVTLRSVLRAKVNTDENNQIINGDTTIPGVPEQNHEPYRRTTRHRPVRPPYDQGGRLRRNG